MIKCVDCKFFVHGGWCIRYRDIARISTVSVIYGFETTEMDVGDARKNSNLCGIEAKGFVPTNFLKRFFNFVLDSASASAFCP